MMMNDMLNPYEVGQYLNVSESTLYRWRRKGVGPEFIRYPTNRIFYHKSDLDRWLKQQKTDGYDLY